jgi:hypothetical protein
LEEKAEGRMGGVYERFKVCPIGAGEQALEMEGNERSGVRSQPLHPRDDRPNLASQPARTHPSGEAGRKRERKERNPKGLTRQSAG